MSWQFCVLVQDVVQYLIVQADYIVTCSGRQVKAKVVFYITGLIFTDMLFQHRVSYSVYRFCVQYVSTIVLTERAMLMLTE